MKQGTHWRALRGEATQSVLLLKDLSHKILKCLHTTDSAERTTWLNPSFQWEQSNYRKLRLGNTEMDDPLCSQGQRSLELPQAAARVLTVTFTLFLLAALGGCLWPLSLSRTICHSGVKLLVAMPGPRPTVVKTLSPTWQRDVLWALPSSFHRAGAAAKSVQLQAPYFCITPRRPLCVAGQGVDFSQQGGRSVEIRWH